MTGIIGLLHGITPGAALPGAACLGMSPAWDLDVDGETHTEQQHRHAMAIRVCRNCAELPTCTDLLPTLPTDTTGVWAGVILTGRKTRP